MAIAGTKKVGDIEISNIKIKLIEKDHSEITANVENTSENYLESTNVELRAIDENGDTYEIFGGIITSLVGRENNTFKTFIFSDITNAKDIEFIGIGG